MFWTEVPSIIRSLDTVFRAIGICHTICTQILMNYEYITLKIQKDKFVQCPVHSCFPIFDKTGKFNEVYKNSQL